MSTNPLHFLQGTYGLAVKCLTVSTVSLSGLTYYGLLTSDILYSSGMRATNGVEQRPIDGSLYYPGQYYVYMRKSAILNTDMTIASIKTYLEARLELLVVRAPNNSPPLEFISLYVDVVSVTDYDANYWRITVSGVVPGTTGKWQLTPDAVLMVSFRMD